MNLFYITASVFAYDPFSILDNILLNKLKRFLYSTAGYNLKL